MQNKRVDYKQLLTILKEIEVVINNRPLTFLYDEPGVEVLTTNHLLFRRKLNTQAYTIEESVDISKNLRYFWESWYNEYLLNLRESQKRSKFQRSGETIRVKDMVLINDEKRPRTLWKVGIVENIKPSSDGKIRGARVRYVRNGKTLFVDRPINKLVPLEVRSNEDFPQSKVDVSFVDDANIPRVKNM